MQLQHTKLIGKALVVNILQIDLLRILYIAINTELMNWIRLMQNHQCSNITTHLYGLYMHAYNANALMNYKRVSC